MSIVDYGKMFSDSYLVNREISQEKWISNSEFTDVQKNKFLKQFKFSKVLYSIPVSNTELQVIEVMLTYPSSHQKDFAWLIHKSIPYPVLLIQNYKDEELKISTVISHANQRDEGKEVIDKSIATPWISMERIKRVFPDINDFVSHFCGSRSAFEWILFEKIEDFGKQEASNRALFPDLYCTHTDTLEELLDDYRKLDENNESVFEKLINIQEQLSWLLSVLPESEEIFDEMDALDFVLSNFSVENDIDTISIICENLKEFLSEYFIAEKTMDCFADVVRSMREEWYGVNLSSDN